MPAAVARAHPGRPPPAETRAAVSQPGWQTLERPPLREHVTFPGQLAPIVALVPPHRSFDRGLAAVNGSPLPPKVTCSLRGPDAMAQRS